MQAGVTEPIEVGVDLVRVVHFRTIVCDIVNTVGVEIRAVKIKQIFAFILQRPEHLCDLLGRKLPTTTLGRIRHQVFGRRCVGISVAGERRSVSASVFAGHRGHPARESRVRVSVTQKITGNVAVGSFGTLLSKRRLVRVV